MDEQLTSLIQQARQQARGSQQRQQLLTQIADEILRSRKICRPPRGQPLYGVYQEIYQEVRELLLHDVDREIDNYHARTASVSEWANTLRDRIFRAVLNEEKFQRLALTAQQQHPQTEKKQYALRELIEATHLSGKLCRPHLNRVPLYLYDLIYEESVNQTLLYICQKIDKYDPRKGQTGSFMTWVNFRLDKLVLENLNTYLNSERLILLDEAYESKIVGDSNSSLLELIREYLELDSEGIFKRQHIRGQPNANFQTIALARISGKSWTEISAELGGIQIPTLSNFFQRCCRKFAAKFREL